jgi:ABC-2 type transport system permease protein
MRRLSAIRLVATREIRERGRSRGFLASVVFTQLLIVAMLLLPRVLGGDGSTIKVGLAEPVPTGLAAALNASATPYKLSLILRTYPDRAAAEAALKTGDVEGVLAVPADLSGPGEVVVKGRPDSRLQAIATGAVTGLRLVASGISPAGLAAAATPPTLVTLGPDRVTDDATFFLANIGVILLFYSIYSFGFWVLTGVIEEKQSRVVEVVLSTVRPRDLLMGKVFGIGLLGIAQLFLIIATALVATALTKSFELPATTLPTMALMLVWFVLGFTLYSTAFGALGALAGRLEEASNASTPISLVAIASYFVAIIAVTGEPDGLIAHLATFFPPAAPMVVPIRAAFGAIGPLEIIGSALVTIAATYALFVVGGRIYAGAVLGTTGRMKLRDAWRAASR